MRIISQVMSAGLYYLIALPISWLPFWCLRGMMPLVYFVVYRVLGYRRTVVRENLRKSFPNRTIEQLDNMERRYFRYLSQLFLESVKNVSLSRDQLRKRLKVINPEVLDDFYAKERSVLLVGSHYCNWEYMVAGQSLLFRHQAVGIGAPITSNFWDRKLTERRERFGMRVINKRNLHEKLNEWKDEALAILVLFDQSPVRATRAYWTNFLSRPTGFLFGTEKLAFMYDMPVVQYEMRETKHGYYEIELKLITEYPRTEEYGSITERLVASLEAQIHEAPEYWLWSHKRWKRQPPEDLAALCRSQEEKYESWKAKFAKGYEV